MRKNGFTLIELLAVIVILAIIALIATPIILGIINDAREKANERSVELYASAVRNAIASYQLTGTTAPKSFSDLDIQYDGEVECTTEELYEDGSFYIADCTVNGTEVEYSYGRQQLGRLKTLCAANQTKIKALIWDSENDPGQETSYEEVEVGLLASIDGLYMPGVVYTCNFIDESETNDMIFFVLSSTSDSVTLISGTNLGYAVWSEDGNNHKEELEENQGLTAKAVLTDKTSNWKKLTEKEKTTIKLPTANQIAKVMDQTFAQTTISGLPKWLCPDYNNRYGYWTSTPNTSDSNNAWYVSIGGYLESYDVLESGVLGVRPVITLSI